MVQVLNPPLVKLTIWIQNYYNDQEKLRQMLYIDLRQCSIRDYPTLVPYERVLEKLNLK